MSSILRIGSIVGLLLLAFACARALPETPPTAQSPQERRGLVRSGIDESRLVDLTYSFDETTVYWPTEQPFHWEKVSWHRTTDGNWYAAGRFSASEHGGTHIDSPIHNAEGKATVDELPVTQLVGPAVVIDISAACAKDPDYQLTAEDVAAWERRHGRILAGAIVLVRTGWGKFWPDRKKYLGDDTPGDEDHLHFPGIAREAAELLVTRHVDGVGIDTASLDAGASNGALAHRVFSAASIYGLENVANLDRLPAQGATLIALPFKIKGGSGGPVRIIAILP